MAQLQQEQANHHTQHLATPSFTPISYGALQPYRFDDPHVPIQSTQPQILGLDDSVQQTHEEMNIDVKPMSREQMFDPHEMIPTEG